MSSKSQEAVVTEYLEELKRLISSGKAKEEESFYPAVNQLLNDIGSAISPPRTTVPHPAAISGDHPDNAIYEAETWVLTLPVEVKPAAYSASDLLELSQAHRYAKSFGAGRVLLTNLWQFIWAETDGEGGLKELDRVDLLPNESACGSNTSPVDGSPAHLLAMLEAVTALRSVIEEPKRVAELLAYHARTTLDRINAAGAPKKLLNTVADSLRDGLGMRLEDDFFAPTAVQTLVYGLFAAWLDVDDPKKYDRRDALQHLHVPAIAELFHQILSPAFVKKCDLTPNLDAAARTLAWVDRDSFTDAFDDHAIEYFYEPFLAEFDPDLRDALGVWFTPSEIAEYQVARVDHELRAEFSLSEGLADDSVIVLDPALGTGTYLVHVLRCIYDRNIENGEPPAHAAAAALEAALTRVIGFEILPAAFLIAHLHIRRFLKTDLAAGLQDSDRLRIYLTNSLTGWGTDPPPTIPLPELKEEIEKAREVKKKEKVLVIIGNPPYEGYSTAETEEEKELVSAWIKPLWPVWGLRKHRLGDLYIRFWRIAVLKIATLTGQGIISFITNRKWLGGRSFPAMREDILKRFQKVKVDDLHGRVHDTSHPGDKSVFTTETAAGIQRGVAVATLIRHRDNKKSETAKVLRRDFRGSGKAKRKALLDLATKKIDEGLSPQAVSKESRWRLVPSTSGDDPGMDEYFRFFVSGVQPVRDDAVTDFEKDELKARMKSYFDFDGKLSHEKLFKKYPEFRVERARYDPKNTRTKLLQDTAYDEGKVVPFLFKPFDARYLYWEVLHKLLNEPRRALVRFYIRDSGSGLDLISGQYAIVVPQTARRPGAARGTVTTGVPGFHVVDPDARVLPRFHPTEDMGSSAGETYGLGASSSVESNIKSSWIRGARNAGLTGNDTEVGDRIFFALVAVQNSPEWLKSTDTEDDDFAPIPLPQDPKELARAARIGSRVAEFHDPFSAVPGVTSGKIHSEFAKLALPPAPPKDRKLTAGGVQRGGEYETREGKGYVAWNDEDGWMNVPLDIWEFSLGGFQVLPKWLGYRHYSREGRPLSNQDIREFTLICRRIAAIRKEEKYCDEIFASAQEASLEEN